MKRTLSIALLVVVVAAAARVTAQPDPATVMTDRGPVHGAVAANVRTFWGVPYAAPPIGALRFTAPQPRAAWTTALDATKPGFICPQNGNALPPMDEDCLNLNVWTPNPVSGKRPVMLWVHGGGDQVGSGMYFDASKLVSTGNIVVVTINYRQGILGWLAAAALDAGDHRVGNYGQEDIFAAAAWVKRNIAAFGGDPNNVTLAGESGGAMHTCTALTSPLAATYFKRGIIQSGPCARPWPSVADKETEMAPMLGDLGCTGSNAAIAACLRAAPVPAILAVQAKFPGHPYSVSVGPDVPAQPRSKLGTFPLLLGGNLMELGAYIAVPKDAAEYNATIAKDYGPNAAAVLAKYPPASYPDLFTALATTETDYAPPLNELAYCWDMRTFALQAAANGPPLYAYEFEDVNAPISLRRGGAVHSGELQYLFPLYPGTGVYPKKNPPLAPESQALSDTMVRYWTNYVTSGDPNGPGLPRWTPYRAVTDVQMLGPGSTGVRNGVDMNAKHQCPFWNGLGYAN